MTLSGPLGLLFDVSWLLLAVVGAATVAWAAVLHGFARARDVGRWLRVVAIANVAGALGIGVLAVIVPTLAGQLLLLAVAAQVATFAGFQIVALRRH